MKDKICKYRDIILLTIGTMLVFLSLCLLFYERIELLKSNVYAEVEMEKYHERNVDGTVVEEDDEELDDDEINEIDDEENQELPKAQSASLKSKIAK